MHCTLAKTLGVYRPKGREDLMTQFRASLVMVRPRTSGTSKLTHFAFKQAQDQVGRRPAEALHLLAVPAPPSSPGVANFYFGAV